MYKFIAYILYFFPVFKEPRRALSLFMIAVFLQITTAGCGNAFGRLPNTFMDDPLWKVLDSGLAMLRLRELEPHYSARPIIIGHGHGFRV
jgi:hypothetical protein